jgi:hypothetical protein
MIDGWCLMDERNLEAGNQAKNNYQESSIIRKKPRPRKRTGHSNLSGYFVSSLAPEDRLEITLTNGKNIEMTMKPTTNPRPTIMIGSKAAVNEASVASTSAS